MAKKVAGLKKNGRNTDLGDYIYVQPPASLPPNALMISVYRTRARFCTKFQLFCSAATTAVFVPSATYAVEDRVYVVIYADELLGNRPTTDNHRPPSKYNKLYSALTLHRRPLEVVLIKEDDSFTNLLLLITTS